MKADRTAAFDLVTVQVGQDAVEVPVYRELLSLVSPYFHNAFDGRLKQATDVIIPWLDTSEATFQGVSEVAAVAADDGESGNSGGTGSVDTEHVPPDKYFDELLIRLNHRVFLTRRSRTSKTTPDFSITTCA